MVTNAAKQISTCAQRAKDHIDQDLSIDKESNDLPHSVTFQMPAIVLPFTESQYRYSLHTSICFHQSFSSFTQSVFAFASHSYPHNLVF